VATHESAVPADTLRSAREVTSSDGMTPPRTGRPSTARTTLSPNATPTGGGPTPAAVSAQSPLAVAATLAIGHGAEAGVPSVRRPGAPFAPLRPTAPGPVYTVFPMLLPCRAFQATSVDESG
jgi:hypothetical protein